MSLNGTTLFELRYDESEHSVRCILNIENWTTWLLTDPLVRPHLNRASGPTITIRIQMTKNVQVLNGPEAPVDECQYRIF